jgi:putative transposase
VYFIRKNGEPQKRRNKKMINDKGVLNQIEKLVRMYPYYGYRKITAILQHRYKMNINRKRVYRIMKENTLLMPASFSHRKLFRGIPMSMKVSANRSNELWGIDMTYIWCGEDGWAYMHAVIDHYDKTLLGYYFNRSCSALGGVMALGEAASKRPVQQLELRSDNGCYYGARIFRDEIRRLGINHTRTMVNTPKGNAIIERFFRSLKEECAWQYQFKNFEEAKVAVDHWIAEYNSARPHQTLGYIAPEEFYERNPVREVA